MYVQPRLAPRSIPRSSAVRQLFVLLLGALLLAAVSALTPGPGVQPAREGDNGACCPQFTPTIERLYPRLVEAESFSSKVGKLRVGATADPYGGGQELQYVSYGSYTVYDNVNFGAGLRRVELRGASPRSGTVSFRLGGPTSTPFCVISWAPTASWTSYSTQSYSCSSDAISGYKTVYVTFQISGLNTNYFTFVTR